MKSILFLFLFSFKLYSLEFSVATYNLENFFDLEKDGTEYDEYIPNSPTWNKKAFLNKLQNSARVINDLDADILVIEEIENKNALLLLMKKLKYRYFAFDKKEKASIGLAVLSKYPIVAKEIIDPDPKGDFDRNILKTTISLEDKKFIVYANHWRSKKGMESKRIKYALTLLKYLKNNNNSDEDYIIIGDLNSNYDEFITFKYEKTLNDTYGIAGINQVLNTVENGNFITKENILESKGVIHFNPWLELPKVKRFSLHFKGEKGTPDNILLSKNLFDNNNISYIPNSFEVFKPSYLFSKNGSIKRWNKNKKDGFSDHLPIIASFTTDSKILNSQHKTGQKIIKEKISKNDNNSKIYKVSDLYEIETIKEPIKLENLLVTYKSDKLLVLKGYKDRSIQYYNSSNIDFELGYWYDINLLEIDDYFGAKEIKQLEIIAKKTQTKNIKSFYLNGLNVDLDNSKYQNEIVTNLKGIYKNGYLYYQNKVGMKKIKIYFKKDLEKPKDGTYFVLKNGILTSYRSKKQILINSYDEYQTYRKK